VDSAGGWHDPAFVRGAIAATVHFKHMAAGPRYAALHHKLNLPH